MARALWKGSIAFGLVSIPVELHTAVRDSRPRFRLLHADDRSPVHFERVCAREGKAVSWEELVKGYEYEKGRFVVLTKEDFRAAALEKTRTVDILSFVRAEEIDDRFFEAGRHIQGDEVFFADHADSGALPNSLNRIGNRNRVKKVDETSPPMMTMANGRCVSEPIACEVAAGRRPSEASSAVISTGRSRRETASMIAASVTPVSSLAWRR